MIAIGKEIIWELVKERTGSIFLVLLTVAALGVACYSHYQRRQCRQEVRALKAERDTLLKKCPSLHLRK